MRKLVNSIIDLGGDVILQPFPHAEISNGFDSELGNNLIDWFKSEAPWKEQSIDGFYESYNINLKKTTLPQGLSILTDKRIVEDIIQQMEFLFNVPFTRRYDLTAQKLVPGQRIRVHSDFGPNNQTHRILIQLNKNWNPQKGGILFLLENEAPTSENGSHKVCSPDFGNIQIFEISEKSFHAVSEIIEDNRYTIVYSLYSEGGYDAR